MAYVHIGFLCVYIVFAVYTLMRAGMAPVWGDTILWLAAYIVFFNEAVLAFNKANDILRVFVYH